MNYGDLLAMVINRTRWRRKSSFNTPSRMQPLPDGCSLDASSLGPFSHRQPDAFIGQHSNVPSVARLREFRRPSTIIRSVWAIVVDSVKRCVLWSWPHVGVKCFKGVTPSITNHNASTAIILVGLVGCCVAPLLHTAPSDPLCGNVCDSSFTVLIVRGSASHDFGDETTATPNPAISEKFAANRFDGTAIALTNPFQRNWVSRFIQPQDYQSSECSTDKINTIRHGSYFSLECHL